MKIDPQRLVPRRGINRIEKTYRDLTQKGRKIIKLFSGNPGDQGIIFPQNILKEAYETALANQDYHPHAKGLLTAREAIAKDYQSKGVSVDPENILLTSGTSESFFYLFSLLTQAGDNILTPNPAYPLFDHIAKLARIELRQYPLIEEKDWAVDIENLKDQIDSRTKAIVLISPHNPTGAVISRQQILEIVEFANQKNLALICDEVFAEFYFGPGDFPRPMADSSPQLCFTLNGISKMFALPSLKLGWILVSGEKNRVEAAVDELETTADTFLSCHTPIQRALPEIFQKGADFVGSYKKEVNRRRLLAMNLLHSCPAITCVEPHGGFYLMAKIIKDLKITEEEFVIRLMEEKGVFVHPGYFFDYEEGIHCVISYLTQPEFLSEGLSELLNFIHIS